MESLSTIHDFGSVDADNDTILFECFEDHEAYSSVLRADKFLVVGRKGSGKTAMFRKLLQQTSDSVFTFGHDFRDYPWHMHARQATIGIPEHEKYIHSWKYLIFIAASKILLNSDLSLPYSDSSVQALAAIEQFVIDSYGTSDPLVTQVFGEGRSLRLNPAFKINAGVFEADLSTERVPMHRLPTIVQEVNRNLGNAIMEALNPKHKYFIAFDQLDTNFSPDDNEYASRLIGLLLAVRDINLESRRLGKRLIPVVFLREDILENLHFEDKNKLIQNFATVVEWDRAGTRDNLKSLMEKRFTWLLGNGKRVPWHKVFDESSPIGRYKSNYEYMISRTFLRPRDMILFCNKVLDSYKARQADSVEVTGGRFENQDVNFAKRSYSNYLFDELDDELHKHIPNWRRYLEVVRSIGYLQFSRERFGGAFHNRRSLFDSRTRYNDLLRDMFAFSLLGYYRTDDSMFGGPGWVFKYLDSKSEFDEGATLFRVHLGLQQALGLRESFRAVIYKSV